MFFFLFSLILSNQVEMVDDRHFKKVINESEYVVALLIDETEDNFWQHTERFSHITESFSNAKYDINSIGSSKTVTAVREPDFSHSFFKALNERYSKPTLRLVT